MKHIKQMKFGGSVSKSSNKFLNGLYTNTSKGVTDNGAVTFTRSGSPLLDFYAQAGAMRKAPKEALELFKKAFSEDEQTAVRILFYLRDVRGGQGERDLFRICLEWLGMSETKVFEKIIGFVPEYGRWDDLFFDNEKCLSTLKLQLLEDIDSEKPSLLAKWLPTINASSPKTKAKARFMADSFDMYEKKYRLAVRDVRKKIKIVESQMSANKWEDINYSHVPSQASRIYKDAFLKHDETRYSKFIEKAVSGEVKINASTLYPYQIYNDCINGNSETTEALWKQLPDYTRGKNALVVADVSGSMNGQPLSVSVSLALYFAERNKGQFKNHFITFSERPVLQKIAGTTLRAKMNSIEQSQWDMNTNLQAVFDLILNTAVDNNCAVEELPETIYIISDMQFDECCDTHTNFEHIEKKYNSVGYKMPTLVFWNVNASGKNLPVQKNKQGVALVSGFSPVIFKMVVENKSPQQVMLDTVNSERYSPIVL